jgi:Tfp pilus assembly PilM family ATPase
VAIEIASRRVTVVEVSRAAGRTTVLRHASEPLPDGVVVPSLGPGNIPRGDLVSPLVERACLKAGLGVPKRAALVVPDSTSRVSLVALEQVPARAGDLEQLLRWQLRKATPFSLDAAQMSHFAANRMGGSTSIATIVARSEVIREYEQVLDALGIHPGTVDLASFNIANTVLGTGTAPEGDWLLVHLAADATTLIIMRGPSLMFYLHRTAVDGEPLGALVHQTAMYHEDRLGGGAFTGAWVSGAGPDTDSAITEIRRRLGVTVAAVDPRAAAALADGTAVTVETLDAVAAPIGMLVRDQAA